jgi:hypothetical protein
MLQHLPKNCQGHENPNLQQETGRNLCKVRVNILKSDPEGLENKERSDGPKGVTNVRVKE